MKIKVLFITNILSQHQVGLWDEFCKYTDIEFAYLCTRPQTNLVEDRYKTNNVNYVINSYELSDENLSFLIDNQDYLIIGSIEDDRITKLISKKENIIWAYEHSSKNRGLRKNIFKLIKRPFIFKKRMKKFISSISLNNYLLCMSSHTAKDWILGGFKKEQIFKFGYFPHFNYCDNKQLESKDKYKIVWSGRFINWKHPEVAVFILKKLLKADNKFYLDYYGDGPILEQIKRLVRTNNLEEKVFFHGEISPEKMSDEFIKSSISIFSSDYGEGWGNVLGEALSSGCIVFADKRAGSTNYLVNNKNGFSYKGKISLKRQIKRFFKSADNNLIRKNAVETMKNSFSGKVASERLHQFILSLYKEEKFIPYNDGPLSKA